jgi:hypothetical protein
VAFLTLICAEQRQNAIQPVQSGAQGCTYCCFKNLIIRVVGSMELLYVVVVHLESVLRDFLSESSER